MGSAASKTARKLPKHATRPAVLPRPSPEESKKWTREPHASETKDETILKDAQDPDFLANLNRLGPVKVNQPAQLIRTSPADRSRQLLENRLRADQGTTIRNRVSATTLSSLLDQRKSGKSPQQIEELVKGYGLEPAIFQQISKYVNSPSIQGGSVMKTVGKDGEENLSVLAVWAEPSPSS